MKKLNSCLISLSLLSSFALPGCASNLGLKNNASTHIFSVKNLIPGIKFKTNKNEEEELENQSKVKTNNQYTYGNF